MTTTGEVPVRTLALFLQAIGWMFAVGGVGGLGAVLFAWPYISTGPERAAAAAVAMTSVALTGAAMHAVGDWLERRVPR